ncbi:MAG: ATP-binding protein, partial [Leptolyngbyaceae bacterium]|nr:ATP-binding protein [Leptolyngbyaceae bacterium]
EAYYRGRLWSIADVQAEALAGCHQSMLAEVQVRSMMAVSIQYTISEPSLEVMKPLAAPKLALWGLLVIHQCRDARVWTEDEQQLVQAVANQLAIAIEQATLVKRLQTYTQDLEEQVNQRTESLQRSLQQEHAARVTADYFRLFLERSSDVFVEYDSELRYLSINPAGSALMGQDPVEILGKTNQELMGVQAEAMDHPIRQAFQTCQPVFVNHEVILPDGSKSFESIYTPIVEPEGSVRRVIGICRDITELRQQWQLLEFQNHQLAETTRMKEEFIATTSHELRTPLTAILGFSNVLLQEYVGALNDKQKDYLDRIHQSGQHLLALINDILDLSRLEADRLELEMQQVFIVDICESVISLVQERASALGLALEIDLQPDLEQMVTDPRRLKQMLLNLLNNAVKFTPVGKIGLKIYHSAGMSAGALDMIHFVVWDTGIGIAPSDQSLLFSPFSQLDSSLARHHQGTGLGLAITRKLAELHGGSITLESQLGQGSHFTLSLPWYTSPEALIATGKKLNQSVQI